MIVSKDGHFRSVRPLDVLEEQARQDYAKLSEEEREVLRLLLAELQQSQGEKQTQITVTPQAPRLIDVLGASEFHTTPVDVETFVKDDYFLGHTCSGIYPKWLEDLKELFSGGYNEAVFTGSIGTGKTFIASIGICRVLYELSCMKNPQRSFGLATGSMLAVTTVSVNEVLARKVAFENIAHKIKPSPYFQKHFPFEATQKELRFPKNLWVVARATTDSSMLGLNVIASLMDESNFLHKNKVPLQVRGRTYAIEDQAEKIYTSIKRRMKSRFERAGRLPGMLFVVSSKQTHDDFTSRRIEAAQQDSSVFVRDYSLWSVKPEGQFSSRCFYVLVGNDKIPSRVLLPGEELQFKGTGCPEGCVLLEVPEDFRMDFEKDLENSIRDIAGVSTHAVNVFIQKRESIHNAIDGREHPFTVLEYDPSLPGEFRWDLMVDLCTERGMSGVTEQLYRPKLLPKVARHVHIDPSLTGDATGFCMTHIRDYTEVIRRAPSGELFKEVAPVIVVDLLLKIVPPLGGELILADVRKLIYDLTRHGYNIQSVTMDSFQSADSLQQLTAQGYDARVLSVDITSEPYEVLKSALYDGRIFYYKYPVLLRELGRLQEVWRGGRRKIDHPDGESKDVSDALAGCVFAQTKTAAPLHVPFLQGSAVEADPWLDGGLGRTGGASVGEFWKPLGEEYGEHARLGEALLDPLFVGSDTEGVIPSAGDGWIMWDGVKSLR